MATRPRLNLAVAEPKKTGTAMIVKPGHLGGVTGATSKKKRGNWKKGVSGNPAGRQVGLRITLTEMRRRLYADSGMMPLDFLVAVYRDELYTKYERHLMADGKTAFFVKAKYAKHIPIELNQRITAASNAASYLHKKMPVGVELGQGNESSVTASALAGLPQQALAQLLNLLDQVENAAAIEGQANVIHDE